MLLKLTSHAAAFAILAFSTPIFAADWAILDGEIETIETIENSATNLHQANQSTKKNTHENIRIKKDVVELDLDSIVQMAHISKAWVRISYPKAVPIILEATKQERAYRSMMYRIIFDCINARYVYANTLAYQDIQGRGEMLGRNKLNEREAIMQMKDIAPDSIAARVFKYSCQAPAKVFK